MANVLFVIDPQNDFIIGSLGSQAARDTVPAIVEKIRRFDGKVYVTQDTHESGYMETLEGRNLPVPHCFAGTTGWEIYKDIAEALKSHRPTHLQKHTFGNIPTKDLLDEICSLDPKYIEVIGFCTDICVVTNALILKTLFPDTPVRVDSLCCAGTSKEAHEAALVVMKSCQIQAG